MKWLVILAIEAGILGWMSYQIYQLCTLACAVGAYGW
jgi:hypothetical protein